jgi:ketosteroid isomerase-like protein
MPVRLNLFAWLLCSLAAPALGCAHPGPAAPSAAASAPTTPAELMALDAEFSRLSVAQGAVVAFDRYLADDAVELPNGADPQRGKPAILASLREDFASGNLVLSWTPLAGDVAASGDLGFTYGTFELTVRKAAGEGPAQVFRGKYASVWKRTAAGWRVVMDMGNKSPDKK